jgi:hypothetical protein
MQQIKPAGALRAMNTHNLFSKRKVSSLARAFLRAVYKHSGRPHTHHNENQLFAASIAPPSSSTPQSSMAGFTMLFCLVVLTAACASTTTTTSSAARPAELVAPAPAPAAWRGLFDGEGSQQCWETLMEIKSCTGEIILFFLNGEAYLGPGCCRAIRVIERRCWAADAMLARHRVHAPGRGHAQGLLRRRRG